MITLILIATAGTALVAYIDIRFFKRGIRNQATFHWNGLVVTTLAAIFISWWYDSLGTPGWRVFIFLICYYAFLFSSITGLYFGGDPRYLGTTAKSDRWQRGMKPGETTQLWEDVSTRLTLIWLAKLALAVLSGLWLNRVI